ncbi:MAG TPA: hypothetical protein VMZ91_07315 [Candidatus Paceibacterota bacterium]|nr:hypothetical protein [Candidatus Paceibacterota bacterium]
MSKETKKTLSPEEISQLREDNIKSLQKQISYLKVLHEHDRLKSEIAEYRLREVASKVKLGELTGSKNKESE